MMCVCVTGHRYVGYVQIMRWQSSNIGQQPLKNLGSVAYCCAFILDPTRSLLLPSYVLFGRYPTPTPTTPTPRSIMSKHRIIPPT